MLNFRSFILSFILGFSIFYINQVLASLNREEALVSEIMKNKLHLRGDITLKKLEGGHSGAKLFIGTHNKNKYVLRIITHKSKKHREQEMHNLKVASEGGYGPKIYLADPEKGLIIMEFLENKPPQSYQELESDDLYIAFAKLAQKIHQGKEFDKNFKYDAFERIKQGIRETKPKYEAYIPFDKIEKILGDIQLNLSPHLTSSPCHNDLHFGNLIRLGKTLKAIDYEDASENDPYFDLATLLNVLDSGEPEILKTKEELFLSSYFERKPTNKDKAKLYLMKQIVWLKWSFDSLKRLSLEDLKKYKDLKLEPWPELFKAYIDKKLDMNKKDNQLKVLKAQLQRVFTNYESLEYKNALAELKK